MSNRNEEQVSSIAKIVEVLQIWRAIILNPRVQVFQNILSTNYITKGWAIKLYIASLISYVLVTFVFSIVRGKQASVNSFL
jgi:hypothetical protein